MVDPFAAALAVLHAGPCSVWAEYSPPAGLPVRIRVIRSQPTEELGSGMLADTNMVQIRRADVTAPTAGDPIAILQLNDSGAEISRESFTIQGGARLDVEGVTWNCYLETA